jgi:hypothetical protein
MDEVTRTELRLLFREISSRVQVRFQSQVAALTQTLETLLAQDYSQERVVTQSYNQQIRSGQKGKLKIPFIIKQPAVIRGLIFNSRPVMTQRCHQRFFINECVIGAQAFVNPFEMNGLAVGPGEQVTFEIQFKSEQFDQPLHVSLLMTVPEPAPPEPPT